MHIRRGRILCVGGGSAIARKCIDAKDLLMLPGIVDIHGDSFERQLMPRPQVRFDLRLALLDTDRQLVANGITTAFHGVTISWEPGLRSSGTARDFVDRLKKWVPAGIKRLAAAARGRGLPMASHDDETARTRKWYHDLGCAICEFPVDRPTADAALEMGDSVVLGAPNVIHGTSQYHRLSAREMIQEGRCGVLASDYYYPSLIHAAFLLVDQRMCPLKKAWDLISRNPAQAAGFTDRGTLTPGKRADFILVDDSERYLPRVVATYVGGRVGLLTDSRFAPADKSGQPE
jgi:alpha-D-ribose 1-methylphosphonate 5-triphosphate diphosphatase PhnM